jgi:hypothetical protein
VKGGGCRSRQLDIPPLRTHEAAVSSADVFRNGEIRTRSQMGGHPGIRRGREYLMKRRIVAIGMLAAMFGLMPGLAQAGQPVGGCPNNYDLVKAKKSTVIADLNGDGYVCVTPIPAFPPGSINAIDNNTP